VEISLTQLRNTKHHAFVINSFLLALSQIRCSMDFGDDFNNFVVNELIDSSSLDDDENFYFDGANIVAKVSQDEPIHQESIIGHRIVNRERLS
jgi:predicted AAA+ superfamily ATPase